MALFLPGLAGSDYRQKTVDAALDLAASVDNLPIGVAANAGISFVGNVGSGTVLDFTAVGDAVERWRSSPGLRVRWAGRPGRRPVPLGG